MASAARDRNLRRLIGIPPAGGGGGGGADAQRTACVHGSLPITKVVAWPEHLCLSLSRSRSALRRRPDQGQRSRAAAETDISPRLWADPRGRSSLCGPHGRRRRLRRSDDQEPVCFFRTAPPPPRKPVVA